GKQEAASIINRLTSSLQVRPFDFARKADPQQVLNFIQNEHPQTIALILSYLDPEQYVQILSELVDEVKADIASSIANIESIPQDVIPYITHVLTLYTSSLLTYYYSNTISTPLY